MLPLFGATPEALAAELGCELGEARRLIAGLWNTGSPVAQRPVRRALQAAALALPHGRPRIRERVADPVDRSVRYVLEADDGAAFEVVRIPLAKPEHFTLCLSSQVGCAMRCAFCQTGTLGLRRHLSTEEICGAFHVVREDSPGRVSGAVFMGQGEPFHNYDAVIRAAQLLRHPNGGRLPAESITISTVGLVPQIHRFAQEKQPFRLIVSLSSAIPKRRESLLPVAAKWSLHELAGALRAVHAATGDRVTVAWVLLGGLNDGADEVAALQALLGDLPLRINLIDVNVPPGAESPFRRATDAERARLLDALQVLGVPVVRRYSVGQSQNSACGLLAARTASLAP